jgi:hypothetical protein
MEKVNKSCYVGKIFCIFRKIMICPENVFLYIRKIMTCPENFLRPRKLQRGDLYQQIFLQIVLLVMLPTTLFHAHSSTTNPAQPTQNSFSIVALTLNYFNNFICRRN